MRSSTRWALAALAGAGTLLSAGCESGGKGTAGDDQPTVKEPGKKAPEYNAVARKYNERVELLGRLFARTIVTLTFTDEDGKRRSERGEGFLQIVRPDKLAMSMSKVGKRLLWFGSDGERYWWIDLVDRKRAYVGKHANYDKLRERGVVAPGLGLRPLDLIQMLGTSPLPVDDRKATGATQWSADGKRLGITVARGAGRDKGFTRLWIDPGTYEPAIIELLDSKGRALVVTELNDYEHVELRNRGGNSPRVAQLVVIAGQPGGPLEESEVRIWLAGIEDHRVNDDAFKLSVVLDETGVDKADVVDLDTQPAKAAGEGGPDGAGG